MDRDHEILALIGAIRRPNIGALWMGAVAGGLAPKIIQKAMQGQPPVDALAFPWTGCLQSFMNTAGSGPYTHGNPEYISSSDVWRLLHLPQTEDDDLLFNRRPQAPQAPCGKSLPKDCALRVTSHLKCARHEYRYHHWNWDLEEGPTIQDQKFSTTDLSTVIEDPSDVIDIRERRRVPERELDQEASEEATWYIFLWLSINGEGRPSETIYQDE